ncbi:MAG TPA: PASTA domain-containing protein [Gaiellaceae bacterium]|nr:PASTA domain-containing protein [Gaiellaceae bacterium]
MRPGEESGGEESGGGPADAAGPEDVTLAEDDWPVPPEYRAPQRSSFENGAAVQLQPEAAPAPSPPRRRLPHGGVVGLLAGLLLGVAALGVVLAITLTDGTAAEEAGLTNASGATTARTTSEVTTVASSPEGVVTAVPDVSGLTVGEARAKLAESGLEARVEESESDRPEGEIVRQAPKAGAEIDGDRPVLLVVSAGPQGVAVPDVVGLPLSRASREIRQAGFEVEVLRSPSTRPARTVLRQTPSAGARVEPEIVVMLVVADEPAPVEIDVPRLVGLTVADARARVRTLGLRSTVTRVESQRPAGEVVRQSPRPGSALTEGRFVRLEVSSGPALVAVPAVVGLDEPTARARLESAGFDVQVVEEPRSDPGEDGLVVSQSPAGGSMVKQGASVTITVALFG